MSRSWWLAAIPLLVCGCCAQCADEPEAPHPAPPPPKRVASVNPTNQQATPVVPTNKQIKSDVPPSKSDNPPPKQVPVVNLGPEYDVYEALIRQSVASFSASETKPTAFLVYLAGNDPPAEFLKRFADLKIPVKPASMGQGLDPKTPVVGVSLGEVQWQGADKARVMGRVAESWVVHKCGTPWPMNVSRKQGKWCVVVE
jgi:hypothetical protein